jgi:phosphohistidine phosphatase SixA
MKNTLFLVLLFNLLFIFACKEDKKDGPGVEQDTPKITSAGFENDLLFVDSENYQIQTSEPAEFSSVNPIIQISKTGLISRIVSGEVAEIEVTWTNRSNLKTKLYALGAKDDTFDKPYANFHDRLATDPVNCYKQGWKTLRKLPLTGETYAIVLRHADANVGRDQKRSQIENWWKSCDSTLARQLNPQGIKRATEMGKIFKDLKFPIGRVISSEFCRAKSTAELVNTGLPIVTDGRINHPDYNVSGQSLFKGMIAIMKDQPIDNKLTLISTHHPMNESGTSGYPSFPGISPFTWTGAYFIKISADKTITYEGAASYGMFEYWRNLKLKK